VRAERLTARGFRNLADLDRPLPAAGAALLGANGQGKTNFLEALYYPVLARSLRGASDAEAAQLGGPGFQVEVRVAGGDGPDRRAHSVAVAFATGGRRKRIAVDGADVDRVAEAIGYWIAVAFLPSDVGLASGPATERRQYLDRMLSLADRGYLAALARYRAALAQRNSALRQGRPDLAQAFDAPLATAGARVVRSRLRWADEAAPAFRDALASVDEQGEGGLAYRGRPELVEAEAWGAALREARGADEARRTTTVGPHRDDVALTIGGRAIRPYGSTGQQRSAAVALKLIELATLRAACGFEPALLLDDVFAELDRERQRRLAEQLLAGRQAFITAPRRDELPENLELEVWTVERGVVR
jgi:DNA replication and repair protein RecF